MFKYGKRMHGEKQNNLVDKQKITNIVTRPTTNDNNINSTQHHTVTNTSETDKQHKTTYVDQINKNHTFSIPSP